jgi:hypothetical protein
MLSLMRPDVRRRPPTLRRRDETPKSDEQLSCQRHDQKEFAFRYARAREAMYDRWADEIKLISDSRKWLLSKLVPQKYGDRIETTVTGQSSVTLLRARA